MLHFTTIDYRANVRFFFFFFKSKTFSNFNLEQTKNNIKEQTKAACCGCGLVSIMLTKCRHRTVNGIEVGRQPA